MPKEDIEIRVLFPDEAKDYMDRHREGTYTLLDVRQPVEYEEGHLPGAFLMPLPRLVNSLGELDSSKPAIVYCAVGGRSRMAAQLMMHQGFREVYHLQGGIEAWEGRTATGPEEFHLKFVRGDESPREVVSVAYRMEEGLKKFHGLVRARTSNSELAELLSLLIKAEESHERTLLELLEAASPAESSGKKESGPALSESGGVLIEGGVDLDEFIRRNANFLGSVSGYLDLAMMIETQALDLYLRMAAESTNEEARKILLQIGDEEKAHLNLLGNFLDTRAPGSLKEAPSEG